MKKFLTFILVSVFFVFIPVFAVGTSDNSKLSRVYINKLDNNTFTLNVYFDSEYRNKAFIQQVSNGRYIIYLPDTNQNAHTPIIYSDNLDKNRIKLDIEKKPFVEKNKTSSYTRITVNMNADYSLKIISKLQNEDRMLILSHYVNNSQNLMFVLVLAIVLLLLNRIVRIAKTVDKSKGSINIPMTAYIPKEEVRDVQIGNEELKEYVAKKSTTSPIKAANRTLFKSFDLNDENQNQVDNMVKKRLETKSIKTVQQLQKNTRLQQNPIKNNKASQLKKAEIKAEANKQGIPVQQQRTPIQQKQILPIEPKKISELKVNSINISRTEEQQIVKPEVKPVVIEQKKPDILSKINISSNKGLYLAAEGDIIALYGFNAGTSVLLKRFKDLSQLNLQARFFDHSEDGDVYIVRIDSYKSMIAFKENSVCELVVL